MFFFVLLLTTLVPYESLARSSCYDSKGLPKYCEPEFMNAAFERPVHVTNTCGAKGPTEYCLQTDITVRQFQNDYTRCEVCDNANALFAHPAKYLTDYNSDARNEETYWQSETMYEGIQHPNSVNLTLNFGKQIEITYIRIIFHSSRPESMQILKKTHSESDWEPYEYYSSRCKDTYGLDPRERIVKDDQAICVEEYSDIVPLTGGILAFASLQERPSAYNYFDSDVLQEWVTAESIRIVLDRLNTYGDEVFGDPKVLKSYYYAISDIAVGGKCKCNGHANSCPKDSDGELYCQCQHNTASRDCGKCKPFYHDLPYATATQKQPFECRACECHGHTNTCVFDSEAYALTGRGGRCTACQNNTEGFHCEKCLSSHYRPLGSTSRDTCLSCNCDPVGSIDTQCDENGNCQCHPGVAGPKCDRCLPDFFNMTANVGCQPCSCNNDGSQSALCDPHSGNCRCKKFVQGRACDQCRPGYFNLDRTNPYGCQPCFCFGHGLSCESHFSYSPKYVRSSFASSVDGWQAVDDDGLQYALSVSKDGKLEIRSATTSEDVPLVTSLKLIVPEKFLGNQRLSFTRHFNFTLWISGSPPPVSQQDDIVFEGALQNQPVSSISWPIHNFNETIWDLLNERSGYQISRPLQLSVSIRLLPSAEASSQDRSILNALSNLTMISIRPVYLSPFRVAYLDDVVLETAVYEENSPGEAPWVELCSCNKEYSGDFCENCGSGFRRETPYGGPLDRCIPCKCHNHSTTCDPESGACDCAENTSGNDCSLCQPGFYGDATKGTSTDCKPCPCPEVVAGEVITCSRMVTQGLGDAIPVCNKCPKGKTGRLCEICAPGYYSKVEGGELECLPCECSGNADPNAILPCDRESGKCTNCRFDTTGIRCERCLDGFYGDATASTAPKCHSCDCNPIGSSSQNCRNPNGECDCLPNVVGRQCNRCSVGFFNMSQPNGCQACNCNPLGAKTAACDSITGECQCQPNTALPRCDKCLERHFGFSSEGCQSCDCDLIGSEDADCNVITGQCTCKAPRDVIVGRRCDKCAINRYDLMAGCPECPPCYRQVRDSIGRLSVLIEQLRRRLDAIAAGIIGGQASLTDDEEFTSSVRELQELAVSVANEAAGISGVIDQANGLYDTLKRQFDKIYEEFIRESKRLNETEQTLKSWSAEGGMSSHLSQLNNSLSVRLSLASVQLNEAKVLLRDLKMAAVGDFGSGSESGHGLLAQSAHLAREYRAELAEQRKLIEQLVGDTTAKFTATHEAVRSMSRSLPDAIGSETLSARDTLRDMEAQLEFSSKRVTDFFTAINGNGGDQQQQQDVVSMVTTAASEFRESSTRLNTEAQLLSVDSTNNIELPSHIYDPRDRIDALETQSNATLTSATSCARRLTELNKAGKISRQEADSIFSVLDGLRQSAITARENAAEQVSNGRKLLEALWGFSARIDSSRERARGLLDLANATVLRMQKAKAEVTLRNSTIAGAKRDAADLTPTEEKRQKVGQLNQLSANLSKETVKLSAAAKSLTDATNRNSENAEELSGRVSDSRESFEDEVSDRLQTATKTGEEMAAKLLEAEQAVQILAKHLWQLEDQSKSSTGDQTQQTLPSGTSQTLAELESLLSKFESDALPEAERQIADLEDLKRETGNRMELSQRAIDEGSKELSRLEDVVLVALTTPNEDCFLAPAEPT